MSEKKKVASLLDDSNLPTYREAYSDRTCSLCACLSELVYLKFNKPIIEPSNKDLVNKVSKLLDEKRATSLVELIELLSYDNDKEKEKLVSGLKSLNLKLEKLFDTDGTQAMIVSSKKFYFLVFRGTEPSSIKDIKSDLDAKQIQCTTKGKIHKGFNDAFDVVKDEIEDFIKNGFEEKPLLITGHSLGGALATVATKKLSYEKIAACYTFGSPRVGDEDWMLEIKTPIYRIVNSADPVTMLPPGAEIMDILTFASKFIPVVGDGLSKYLQKNFSGYSHAGYMRYLTNIEDGKFEKARLLYSVSFMRRIRAYIFKKSSFSNIPADHKMDVYSKKLKKIAEYRNK